VLQGSQQPAACAAACSYIGHGEVVEALRSGRINSRKSQPALRPCPKYTVDAVVGPRGQRKNVQASAAPAQPKLPAARLRHRLRYTICWCITLLRPLLKSTARWLAGLGA
jgi:hypothetical protein